MYVCMYTYIYIYIYIYTYVKYKKLYIYMSDDYNGYNGCTSTVGKLDKLASYPNVYFLTQIS